MGTPANNVIYTSTGRKEITAEALWECMNHVYEYADGIKILLKHNVENCEDDGASRAGLAVLDHIRKKLDDIYPDVDFSKTV